VPGVPPRASEIERRNRAVIALRPQSEIENDGAAFRRLVWSDRGRPSRPASRISASETLARSRYDCHVKLLSDDKDAAPAVTGHRHGHRPRSLLGSFGKVEIDMPRARLNTSDSKTTEWKSRALRAYQRGTLAADALIAGCYLAGTNTRRVRRALGALFAGRVERSACGQRVRSWARTNGTPSDRNRVLGINQVAEPFGRRRDHHSHQASFAESSWPHRPMRHGPSLSEEIVDKRGTPARRRGHGVSAVAGSCSVHDPGVARGNRRRPRWSRNSPAPPCACTERSGPVAVILRPGKTPRGVEVASASLSPAHSPALGPKPTSLSAATAVTPALRR
jgi:hypothetical protein